MVETSPNWIKPVKIGSNLSNYAQSCQIWFILSKMVQSCQIWFKFVKIGLNLSKFIQTWFNLVNFGSNCLNCVRLVFCQSHNHTSYQFKLSKELSLCTLPWRLKGFSVLFNLFLMFYPGGTFCHFFWNDSSSPEKREGFYS